MCSDIMAEVRLKVRSLRLGWVKRGGEYWEEELDARGHWGLVQPLRKWQDWEWRVFLGGEGGCVRVATWGPYSYRVRVVVGGWSPGEGEPLPEPALEFLRQALQE